MSEAVSDEILCTDCEGACCRMFTAIQLTQEEYDFMEESGAVLLELDASSFSFGLFYGGEGADFVASTPADKKAYLFYRDCPHLVDADGWAKCDIYDSSDRPQACHSFRVGSEACKKAIDHWQDIREVRLQITKKPEPPLN